MTYHHSRNGGRGETISGISGPVKYRMSSTSNRPSTSIWARISSRGSVRRAVPGAGVVQPSTHPGPGAPVEAPPPGVVEGTGEVVAVVGGDVVGPAVVEGAVVVASVVEDDPVVDAAVVVVSASVVVEPVVASSSSPSRVASTRAISSTSTTTPAPRATRSFLRSSVGPVGSASRPGRVGSGCGCGRREVVAHRRIVRGAPTRETTPMAAPSADRRDHPVTADTHSPRSQRWVASATCMAPGVDRGSLRADAGHMFHRRPDPVAAHLERLGLSAAQACPRRAGRDTPRPGTGHGPVHPGRAWHPGLPDPRGYGERASPTTA